MALGRRLGRGARKLASTAKRKIEKDVQKARITIEEVQRAGTRRRLGTAAPKRVARTAPKRRGGQR